MTPLFPTTTPKNNPFISIIIPVYNVEAYMERCVDSILAQKYSNYEIILVDDGSSDRCPEICDRYCRENTNIKVIHKVNGGVSDARNAGMDTAAGEYITFTDSDDFWTGTEILSGIESLIARNSYPDVVVSDCIIYNEAENKYFYPKRDKEYKGCSKYEILHDSYLNHADLYAAVYRKFVKRNLAGSLRFDKSLKVAEDTDWSVRLYMAAETICVNPKPYYCYRIGRTGSLFNTASRSSFDSVKLLIDKLYNVLQSSESDTPDAEKSIYIGYLAQRLSMAMGMYLGLDADYRKELVIFTKSRLQLFEQPLNSKTQKVYNLIKIFGVRTACIIVSLFLSIKRKLNWLL